MSGPEDGLQQGAEARCLLWCVCMCVCVCVCGHFIQSFAGCTSAVTLFQTHVCASAHTGHGLVPPLWGAVCPRSVRSSSVATGRPPGANNTDADNVVWIFSSSLTGVLRCPFSSVTLEISVLTCVGVLHPICEKSCIHHT